MGFTMYTPEMGSNGMKYIPSFIKISSGIQTLIEVKCTHTHARAHTHKGDLISLLLFLQNKKSKLINGNRRKTC
jgi:hypothetical protein